MNKIYCKTAENNKNRIIIPKWYIEKFGRHFYMIVKENGEIILKPINKGE